MQLNARMIIEAFQKKFPEPYQEGNLIFAYHAAFPIFLTSQLLYQLWLNFKHYQNNHGNSQLIPYTAISDFIHSDLCDRVGFDLYEVPRDIRKALLQELSADTRFCNDIHDRQEELANFTYQYADRYYSHPRRQNRKDVLQWTALVALDKGYAAQKMRDFLENKAQKYSNKALLRLHMLINELQEQDEEFGDLVEYSAVLTTNPEEGDTTLLKVPARIRSKMSEKVIEELKEKASDLAKEEEEVENRKAGLGQRLAELREEYDFGKINFEQLHALQFIFEENFTGLFYAQLELLEKITGQASALELIGRLEKLIGLLEKSLNERRIYLNRIVRLVTPTGAGIENQWAEEYLSNVYFYGSILKIISSFRVRGQKWEPRFAHLEERVNSARSMMREFITEEKEQLEWQIENEQKALKKLDELRQLEFANEKIKEDVALALIGFEEQLKHKQDQLKNIEIQERIQDSYESAALDLSNLGLTELPEQVYELTHLEMLILGDPKDLNPNRIGKLDRRIGGLDHLKRLRYSNNRLHQLPNLVPLLSGLEELDISYNNLEELPYQLFDMPNLKDINFFNNPMRDPPILLAGEGLELIRKFVRRELLEEQYVGIQSLGVANEALENEQYQFCFEELDKVAQLINEKIHSATLLESQLIQYQRAQLEDNQKMVQQVQPAPSNTSESIALMIREQLEKELEQLKKKVLYYDVALKESGTGADEALSEDAIAAKIKQILQLINSGDTDRAFQAAEPLFFEKADDDLQTHYIYLQSKWSRLKRRKDAGVITEEDYRAESSTVLAAFVKSLNDLKEKELPDDVELLANLGLKAIEDRDLLRALEILKQIIGQPGQRVWQSEYESFDASISGIERRRRSLRLSDAPYQRLVTQQLSELEKLFLNIKERKVISPYQKKEELEKLLAEAELQAVLEELSEYVFSMLEPTAMYGDESIYSKVQALAESFSGKTYSLARDTFLELTERAFELIQLLPEQIPGFKNEILKTPLNSTVAGNLEKRLEQTIGVEKQLEYFMSLNLDVDQLLEIILISARYHFERNREREALDIEVEVETPKRLRSFAEKLIRSIESGVGSFNENMQTIRGHLLKNEIEEAFRLINSMELAYQEELIVLSAQFKDLLTNNERGIISSEAYQVGRIKIVHALFQAIPEAAAIASKTSSGPDSGEIDEIKKLISSNKLQGSDQFRRFAKFNLSPLHNYAVELWQSNLSFLEKEQSNGTIAGSDYEIRTTKIYKSILEGLELVENGEIQRSSVFSKTLNTMLNSGASNLFGGLFGATNTVLSLLYASLSNIPGELKVMGLTLASRFNKFSGMKKAGTMDREALDIELDMIRNTVEKVYNNDRAVRRKISRLPSSMANSELMPIVGHIYYYEIFEAIEALEKLYTNRQSLESGSKMVLPDAWQDKSAKKGPLAELAEIRSKYWELYNAYAVNLITFEDHDQQEGQLIGRLAELTFGQEPPEQKSWVGRLFS